MSFCRCEHPRQNDRRPEYCRKCGVRFDPRTLCSDENLAAFFARLVELPGVEAKVLLQAQQRERAGRGEFGMKYLGRDNDAEALEEYADGLIYAHLSHLNDVRDGATEIDPNLIEAAHHAALAYAAIERRMQRRRKQ